MSILDKLNKNKANNKSNIVYDLRSYYLRIINYYISNRRNERVRSFDNTQIHQ